MTFNERHDGQALVVPHTAERGVQRYEMPDSTVRPLSRYRPPVNGVLLPDISTIASLCTISAGEKIKEKKDGRETERAVPARDGKIRLHDAHQRAPGLLEILVAREFKSLVIGFAWNDTNRFVRQRMASYRAGGLVVTGDENGLVQWENGQRIELDPIRDKEKFNAAWKTCAPETWVYFHIGAIDQDGPYLQFPDNTPIPYRLRFTSTNSRRNLDSCIDYLKGLGQIAIMPILLQIDPDYPVVKPDGGRVTAPVWTFTPLLGPEGTRDAKLYLDTRKFITMRMQAREQAAAIGALPAPDESAVRYALTVEGTPEDPDPEPEPTPEQIALLARGGGCNAEYWRGRFHGTVEGTPWKTDDGRAKWMTWYTKHYPDPIQTSSLREFLAAASESDAARMLDVLLQYKERLASGAVNGTTGEVKVEPSPEQAPVAAPSPVSDGAGTGEPAPDNVADAMQDGESDDEPEPEHATHCEACGVVDGSLVIEDGRYVCLDSEGCADRARLRDMDDPGQEPPLTTGTTSSTVLRPHPGGGETFACAKCGTTVGPSVKIKSKGVETLYPARQWLAFLAERGIDQALCVIHASEAKARDRKAASPAEPQGEAKLKQGQQVAF